MEHNYIVETDEGYVFVDDTDKRKRTEDTVKEINRLSNLPCKLLRRYSDKLCKDLSEIGFNGFRNYFSFDFECADGVIVVSGYPHDEEKDSVISMTFNTDKYDALGIKVGMLHEQVDGILQSYGYQLVVEKDDEDDEVEEQYYEKDAVRIYVAGEQFLDQVKVEVESFYLGNRVY